MQTEKAQIGILRGGNPRNPFALYVTEILEIEGYSYQLVDIPEDAVDLLIVPDITLSEEQLSSVLAFAGLGGNLLCLRPNPKLHPLFGLKGDTPPYTWADRYAVLEDETRLQFHGPADLLHLAGAETVATLLPELDTVWGRHPAVVRLEEGGRRAAFTFDIARSTVLFHQGRADQASDGSNPDPDGDGMFKPNDLYINHLDPRCKHLPQADIWQDVFVRLLDWLTEKTAPLPRLWRFPDAEPALAFFNGDSDASTPRDLALGFETAERYGSKYTLYLKTDGFETLSPVEVQELNGKGHEVGLHPWLKATPTIPEFRHHLIKEYAGFQKRYGYVPATVRNHSLIIAGWVDTPAIYQEIGVRMDLNVYPARCFQSGYQSGSGLPVKYMNLRGETLDFYQQATLAADDTMLTVKCDLPAHTIDGAIQFSIRLLDLIQHRYHSVYQPCFHPIHFRTTNLKTLPWYEAMQEEVRSRKIRSVNGREWCSFNDARRSVQMQKWGKGWRLSSQQAVSGLTILWPESVRRVCRTGVSQPLQKVRFGGREANAQILMVNAEESIMLEAEWNP